MLDSGILDIAIGVTFVFLSVSLMCSAIREAIETIMKSRASDLERGIRELLSDQDGTGLVKDFFGHPRISALFGGAYDPEKLKGPAEARTAMRFGARQDLPSYIPAEQFSATLIDLIFRGGPYPAPPLSSENLRSAAAALQNDKVRRAVVSALDMAGNDVTRVRAELERWFNGAMDRVSGWYKRRTQMILFAIGLGTAVVLNIDAITITHRLSTDTTLRQAVVGMAEKAAATPLDGQAPADIAQIKDQLDKIGLPIGWEAGHPAPQYAAVCKGKACSLGAGMRLQIAIGWLITAFAVMLGAPFWFDVLNKFIVIRSTVKPQEKSGVEGSKDPTPVGVSQVVAPVSNPGAAGSGTAPLPNPATDGEYTPNEWATKTSDPNAGIL